LLKEQDVLKEEEAKLKRFQEDNHDNLKLIREKIEKVLALK